MSRITEQRRSILKTLNGLGGTLEDPSGFATRKLLEMVGEDAQSMTAAKRTLRMMEDEGLITREVDGRRLKPISITAEGRNALGEEGWLAPLPVVPKANGTAPHTAVRGLEAALRKVNVWADRIRSEVGTADRDELALDLEALEEALMDARMQVAALKPR